MRPIVIFCLASALVLTGCKRNPDTPAGRAADARHEKFEEIGKAMDKIGNQLKSANPKVEEIQEHAKTINDLATQLPTWFPAGSGPDNGIHTDALQAVWTKPAEFKAASDKFIVQAAQFNELAENGDGNAMGAALQSLGGTCKGCHDKFKKD